MTGETASRTNDQHPESIERVFREGVYPYQDKLKRREYEQQKAGLQGRAAQGAELGSKQRDEDRHPL